MAGRSEAVFKSLRVGRAGCSYSYPSSKHSSMSTNTGTYTPEHKAKWANFSPVLSSFLKLSQATWGFIACPQPFCSSSSTSSSPTQEEVPRTACEQAVTTTERYQAAPVPIQRSCGLNQTCRKGQTQEATYCWMRIFTRLI